MITRHFLVAGVFLILVGRSYLFSQDQPPVPGAQTDYSVVAGDIQNGILTGTISGFAKHFAKQVFVDLPGQDGGYFSDRQLFYILQNFFGSRSTQQFRFSTIDDSEAGSYATGSGSFLFKGRREVLQIYVALSKREGRTVITQFNVY
jgi:hypothetical protein